MAKRIFNLQDRRWARKSSVEKKLGVQLSSEQEDTLKLQIKNRLTKNVIWLSAGQGLRLLIQAAFFTIIARSLGVSNFGSFVGVVALVGILYPFGSLGSGNILVKSVARNRESFSEMRSEERRVG